MTKRNALGHWLPTVLADPRAVIGGKDNKQEARLKLSLLLIQQKWSDALRPTNPYSLINLKYTSGFSSFNRSSRRLKK